MNALVVLRELIVHSESQDLSHLEPFSFASAPTSATAKQTKKDKFVCLFVCLIVCLFVCIIYFKEIYDNMERSRAVEERRRRTAPRIPHPQLSPSNQMQIENPVYTVRQKFPYIEIPCIKIEVIFYFLNCFLDAIASLSTFAVSQ